MKLQVRLIARVSTEVSICVYDAVATFLCGNKEHINALHYNFFDSCEGNVEDLDCAHDLWGVLEMPLPLKAQELTELKADVTEIWRLNSIKLSQVSSCFRWLTWLLCSESLTEPPALHCTSYL
jgi:hypothetical protein